MAKKDKVDGTAIEFYIPPSGSGLRGMSPRVPIPINQPHWIYKRNLNTKPGISEWFIIVMVFVAAIALGLLIFTSSLHKSSLWIAVVTLGIFAILLIRSAIIRTFNHAQEAEEQENTISPRKRKKKQPKHRKDYK